jgi:hypothetical protein
VHINGVITRGEEVEQRPGQPLGQVALGIAWKAAPGINRRLVEGLFQVEPHRQAMFHLQR